MKTKHINCPKEVLLLKNLSILNFQRNLFLLFLLSFLTLNKAYTQSLSHPNDWFPLGDTTTGNYQQCFGYGDFDGDGHKEMVGSYSHSAVGLLLHRYINSQWEKEILHPKFDTVKALQIQGMNGTWPMKGFTSDDFDGDGRYEIITYADQIMYPPYHNDTVYPFPGCIYIDYNPDSGKFIPNPLFWGTWGECYSSSVVSVMRATPVSADFRDTIHPTGIKDFLVNTLWYNDSLFKSKFYILEQPASTFNSVDYRYIQPGVMDTDTLFPNEPFYLHHLYVNNGGLDAEMVFTPVDYLESSNTSCEGEVWDYDNDGLVDLAVAVSYLDEGTPVYGSIRVYHRLPALQGKRYRFEEVFRKDIPITNFWQLIPANLNGNASDGKEGFIMNACINGGYSPFGVCGIATLQLIADTFQVLGTYAYNPAQMAADYVSTYSSAAAIDADGDGYDDAAVVMIKPNNFGDIVLFRNLNGEIKTFPELFCGDGGNSKVLWANHKFTWDLHTGDFDDDAQMELGAAEALKLPPYEELPVSYQIFYSDALWTGITYIPENSRTLTAFPNPSDGSFTLYFSTPLTGWACIDIFDLNGRLISNKYNGFLGEGNNTIKCDLNNLSSGIYYCRLITGNNCEVLKIIITNHD